jgi:hypothetical protein
MMLLERRMERAGTVNDPSHRKYRTMIQAGETEDYIIIMS